ncbi:MAG: hypothetical protein ACOC4G_10050 [Bacillota bacterium]
MNEAGRLFWDYVISENIVLVLHIGLLLIIVETPKLRESFLSGLKITAGLTTSILTGWLLSFYISSGLSFIMPGVYFLTSLSGIYIVKKLDKLKGEWMEGLPRMLLALSPFMGLQLFIEYTVQKNSITNIFIIMGCIIGFYLAYIIIAALKEQLKMNETEPIFKSEYNLLIVIGFLAAVLSSFNI